MNRRLIFGAAAAAPLALATPALAQANQSTSAVLSLLRG